MRQFAPLLLFAIATTAAAQPPSIAPGQRIKVETQPQQPRLIGTFLSQTDDSLFVAYRNASRSVESSAITRISASGGKSRSKGAGRGLKVGSAIGGGFALVLFGAGWLAESRRGNALPYLGGWVLSGAIVGGVYGTIIGAAIGSERWNPIYAPAAREPGLGLALRF